MEKAMRDAYGETLAALGEEDPRLVVLDADLSSSTKTSVFARRFPERFFNCGIAEANMMDVAAGLALTGRTVFVSTFAIFTTKGWEQIRQVAAYARLPVKVVASHAGIQVGPDGGSHMCLEDLALMRAIPGMKVVCPADAVETASAVEALARTPGPAYLRMARSPSPVIFGPGYVFHLGRPEVLADGDEVALLATGLMVARALEAREILAEAGVSARVVNVSTVKPIDHNALLEAVAGVSAVVTAEEHSVLGGMGSAVVEVLAERMPIPVVRVGVRDRYGQSGEPEELFREYGLTAREVARAALEALERAGRKKGEEDPPGRGSPGD